MNTGYSNNIAIPNINGLLDINATSVEATSIYLNGTDISTPLVQVPINSTNIAALQQATTGITYTAGTNQTTIANNVTITGTLTTTPTLATQTYVTTAVANLVAAAPITLDTLNELAIALGNDPNFATTTANLIGTKASLTAAQTITGANTFSNTANSFYGSGANLTGIGVPTNMVTTDTDQTITSVKTFNSVPLCNIYPTTNNQLANKSYCDNSVILATASKADIVSTVNLSLSQTITGAKTFSNASNNFTGTFTGSGSGLTLTNLPANTSPVGTIVMYASNSIPTGWLLCDGSLVSSTTYSALFAIIGYTYTLGTTPTTGNFYLPNFIGLFVRGAGSNTYVATSSATTLGQVQPHQVNQHSHTLVSVNTDTQGTTTSTLVVDNVGGAIGLSSTHTSVSNPVVTTTATTGTGRTDYNTYTPGGVIQSNENRPNNISTNYIIKWGGADTFIVNAGTTPTYTQAGAVLNLTNNATSGTTSIVLKNAAGTTVSPITCTSTAVTISVPLTVSTLNLSTITLISPPLMSYVTPPALSAFQIGYTTTFTTASIIPVAGAFLNIGAIWMPNGVWMVTTNNVLVTSAIATVSRIVFETTTSYTTFTNNNSIQQRCNTVVIPTGSAQAYNSTVVLTMAASDRFWANMSCNFTPAGSLTCQATIQATRIA